MLRKVECVTCLGIFKVEDDPPASLLEDYRDEYGGLRDPWRRSPLKLKENAQSVDWCVQHCGFCQFKSPDDGEASET
jgi:hypothetical protein